MKRFLGNVMYYSILTLIFLAIAAFFVGLYILDKWRWSCGGM
jgi:hypothetical protein